MNAANRMIDAVRAGDLTAVKQLLSRNPELVNARTEAGDSAILMAVYHGHIEVAELLLKKASKLDIFEAAAVGHAKRVQELLEADASLGNSFAPDGWTPLHLAVYFGRRETALVLLEKGANVHALSRNDTCNMPLHAAVANRKPNLVRLLLAGGADPNGKTGGGWTALHLAAFGNDREIAEILLAHRPNLNAKNAKGQTALEIALEKGHQEVIDLLRPRKSS